jgi:hypothetical protein
MYIRSTENEANDYIQSVLKRSREIGKKGRPDRKRERALIAAAQAGDDSAMEYLLVCHALFVQSIVLKFRHRGAEIDDLWSCGMDGLRHAITRYDLEKHHVKLVSMAVWWIRQRIEYEIADNFNVIRVPIGLRSGRVRHAEVPGRQPQGDVRRLHERAPSAHQPITGRRPVGHVPQAVFAQQGVRRTSEMATRWRRRTRLLTAPLATRTSSTSVTMSTG